MPRFNRMVVNGAISDRNIFRHSVFVQVKCLQATNTKKYLLLKPHRLPYLHMYNKPIPPMVQKRVTSVKPAMKKLEHFLELGGTKKRYHTARDLWHRVDRQHF